MLRKKRRGKHIVLSTEVEETRIAPGNNISGIIEMSIEFRTNVRL